MSPTYRQPPRRSRPPRAPARSRRPLRALLRVASWHRRPLAAVAAVLAVLTGLSAARPEGPPRLDVVVAAHEVVGGTVLGPTDVEVRAVLTADAPVGALTDIAEVVGRAVSAPVAEGQVLTPLALVSPRASPAGGRVVAPVRVSDAGLVTLLRPGDVVDLVGTDEQGGAASVVARGARVVTVPVLEEEVGGGGSGGLVLVEVPAAAATELAKAAAAGPVSLTWR